MSDGHKFRGGDQGVTDAVEATERVDDTTHEVLADRRRLVIRYLRNTPDSGVSLGELADYVNTYSSNRRGGENVAIRLHHVDLPKLEEAGLIKYEPRSATVRYERRPEVDRVVDRLGSVEPE